MQARLLEDLKTKEKERREYRRRMVAAIKRLQAYEKTRGPSRDAPRAARARARLTGLPAAPGFGRGRAHLLQPPVSFALVEDARSRRPRGRARSASGGPSPSPAVEMESLKERLSKRLPEFDPAIIDAHRLMLEDRGFLGKVEARDRGRGSPPRRRSSASSRSTSTSSSACPTATCASAPST